MFLSTTTEAKPSESQWAEMEVTYSGVWLSSEHFTSLSGTFRLPFQHPSFPGGSTPACTYHTLLSVWKQSYCRTEYCLFSCHVLMSQSLVALFSFTVLGIVISLCKGIRRHQCFPTDWAICSNQKAAVVGPVFAVGRCSPLLCNEGQLCFASL